MKNQSILSKLSLILALAALTVGCAKDDSVVAEPEVDILSRFNAAGKAYMNISLELPLGARTRAVSFVDGEDDEYAIDNVQIIIYHGATGTAEDDLSVASIYNSPTLGANVPDYEEEQVTSHQTATIELSSDNLNPNDHLYAFVFVNHSVSVSTGSSFGSLRTAEYNKLKNGDYFVMCNTPIASANDGSGTVSTLVEIDPNSLFATAEQAAEYPAATIHVERAAAKVSVEAHLTATTIAGNTQIDFSENDFQFALDNYNTSFYLIRHFDNAWLSYQAPGKNRRMVESTALPTDGFRTYWASDQHYADGVTTGLTNSTNTTPTWQSFDMPAYCAENTFDAAHMTDRNTTSVLIRLQLNGGSGFFTTSATGRDIVFQNPYTTIEEQGTSASESFARPRRSSFVTPDAVNYPNGITIDAYLRQWLMQFDDVRSWVDTYAAGDPRFILIRPNDYVAATGLVSGWAVENTSGHGDTQFAALGLATKLSNISVWYYPSGYCYYRVPIRHFSDAETPWAATATMNKTTTASVYGNGTSANDNDYLGRYGVVRNNWYTLSITSVSHVGSPVVPSLTDYADDTVEQLLNAKVEMNAWTTHEQTLKAPPAPPKGAKSPNSSERNYQKLFRNYPKKYF